MLKLENSIRGLSFSRVAFDLTIQENKKDDKLNREQVADKLLHYLWHDVERVSYKNGSLFANGIKSFGQLYSEFKNEKNIFSESVIKEYENL